ncbi:hypothetical protein [Chryseobacterium edaphi]|uniref:hypothetical protein n=1 Tax=Chryseobacterium edaphi TaxID=2976532 RepID=UPI0021D5A9E8|nr:hypothetical protein [Chryseobacterium edaphi]
MKINNKSIIRFLFVIHMCITIVIISLLAGLLFFQPEIFRKIQYIGYLLLIYNILRIFRLKYIEYENSGEVLSLKRYSLFHTQKQQNQIEMPLYKINKLYIKKSFWYNYLIIIFRRDDQKFSKIHFPINHIKHTDLQKIQNNFKNC